MKNVSNFLFGLGGSNHKNGLVAPQKNKRKGKRSSSSRADELDSFKVIDININERDSFEFTPLDSADLLGGDEEFSLDDWAKFINNIYHEDRSLTKEEKMDQRRFKSILRNEIPRQLRAHAYSIYTNSVRFFEKSTRESQKALYMELTQADHSKYLDQVEKDIVRTCFPQSFEIERIEDSLYFPGVDYEESFQRIAQLRLEEQMLRKSLQNILCAYAAFDKPVGYVQGMNSIAGALLYIFFSSKELGGNNLVDLQLEYEEYEVYFTLFSLITETNFRDMLMINEGGLVKRIDEFDVILEQELPDLHDKMTGNGVKNKLKTLDSNAGICITILSHSVPAYHSV